MSAWNMFSNEVWDERKRLRDYGHDQRGAFNIDKQPGQSKQSYKAQALRELAKRLELEEYIKELLGTNARLVNENERLELEVALLKSEA